ncbi:MAG TPA: OmpA family protein [Candidatus Kapabacteria bacterium]|jgi:outer membrane protein OmpA-like peptidoglycan-associated protein|nr:OmpA family protein [Candidatus Kapabacteria bacterium]
MKKLFLVAVLLCAYGCASSSQNATTVRRDQVQNHAEVVVTRLPEGVNTVDDDFGLFQGPGGQYAILTSDRGTGAGRQDLFRSNTSLGQIKEDPTRALFSGLEGVNTSENEGTATFTPDGLTMIFAAAGRGDEIGRSDLYQADYVGGRWTNIRNLRALNTEDWESHPTIAPDGRTLYFVSDREGGIGGQDIYVSSRVGDNWTAPQNLGPIVNTEYHEASPFIAGDDKTMYYSSLGKPGLGGYDVFVTRNVGGVWSEPVNAGTPVNSEFDELFFSAELGTLHAFVASNRDSTLGGLDIFSVDPNPFAPGGTTVVSGIVRDAVTKQPLGAEVTVTNLKTGDEVARFRSDDQSGRYLVVLQPGETYSITAERQGYLFYSDQYEVVKRTDVALVHDIDLYPTAQGKTRLLVFFDFNSATLKRESFPDLNRAASLLIDNPNMLVTVAGHTDSVGSDEYNLKLSQDRATSVKAYLVGRGAKQSQIEAIGYGETQPRADNGTEEGRALNRRVEFLVRREN